MKFTHAHPCSAQGLICSLTIKALAAPTLTHLRLAIACMLLFSGVQGDGCDEDSFLLACSGMPIRLGREMKIREGIQWLHSVGKPLSRAEQVLGSSPGIGREIGKEQFLGPPGSQMVLVFHR